MEACFPLLDFHSPKVFSSSVLWGYGLLLCMLSKSMLSSSLAEVLSSTAVSLPRSWKRLYNFATQVWKYISAGPTTVRVRQAVIESCSFDESCLWMGSSLVPVSVQHSLPQYHLVIRAEFLPCGLCLWWMWTASLWQPEKAILSELLLF